MSAYDTYIYKEAFNPRDMTAQALRWGRKTLGSDATRTIWKGMNNPNIQKGVGASALLGTGVMIGRKVMKNPNFINAVSAARGKPVMQKWMLPAAGGVALTGGLIGRGTAPRRD